MRFLLICIVLMTFFSFSYSTIHLYNSDFEESNLFSVKDLNYYVASNLNDSISLTYTRPTSNASKDIEEEVELKLNQCSNTQIEETYCLQDTIANYIRISNTSFTGSVLFNYEQNNKTSQLFLDLFSPTINLNYSINQSSKELALNLIIGDNLNYSLNTTTQIYKLNSSQQNGSSSTQIYLNSTNQTIFNKTILLSEMGEYSIQISSTDLAGNTALEETIVRIEDIFPPKIKDLKIMNDVNSNIYLVFSLSDSSNLGGWELLFDSRKSSQDYEGQNTTSENVSVLIDRNDFLDSLLLKVFDERNNSQTINNTLTNKIDITFERYFSDTIYILAPNSNSCELAEEVDNVTNNTFNKDNSRFALLTSELEEGEFTFKVECRNSNYINQKEIEFVIDKTPPKIEVFDISALNNGNIEVLFNVSEDTEEIEIYRNDELEYTSKDSEFQDYYEDKSVNHKNEYEYYLIAKDEAGNEAKSSILKISPKKTKINFEMTQTNTDDSLEIQLLTEMGLDGRTYTKSPTTPLEVKETRGVEIQKQDDSTINFQTKEKIVEFVIQKSNATKEVTISLKDDQGNELERSFQVDSKVQKVSEPSIKQNNQELKQNEMVLASTTQRDELNVSASNSSTSEDLKENSSSKPPFFWLVLFILLILIIVLLVKNSSTIIDKYYKHKAYTELKRKRAYKNEYSHSFFNKDYSGFKSNSLDKEIDKRIKDKRQKEILAEEKEKERLRRKVEASLKEKSFYEQQKYKDINSKGQKNESLFSENDLIKSNSTSKKNQEKILIGYKISTIGSKIKNVVVYSANTLTKSIRDFSSNFTYSKMNRDYEEKIPRKTPLFNDNELVTSYSNEEKNMKNVKVSKGILSTSGLNILNTNNISKKNTEFQKLKTGEDTVEKEAKSPEEFAKQDRKEKIEWGDYLKNKSKSRKWFLLQKEVDNELKDK